MRITKQQQEIILRYNSLAEEILGDWKPYEYQKKVLQDLFVKNKKYVFCNWPRKSGKSEIAAVFLILKALMVDNSTVYYVCETRENAEAVIWKRLKAMIPKKYLLQHGFRESKKEVKFSNGSSIILHGSSGVDTLIGTQPDSLVYDEYRTHKKEFHDVMGPNDFKSHCQCLIISTPPDMLDRDNYQKYQNMKKFCQDKDTNSYYTMNCWEGNPNKDIQAYYRQKQEEYHILGRDNEFRREFLCEDIRGTVQSMFPEFQYDDLMPHEDIIELVRENRNQYKWHVCFDTSGWRRWGILFVVLDEKKSSLYVLDCLVIKAAQNSMEARDECGMYASAFWPRVLNKMQNLYPQSTLEDWNLLWDPADVIVMDDVRRTFGAHIHIDKVNKRTMGKSDCFNLIRDLRNLGRIFISTRAEELIDEFVAMKLNSTEDSKKKDFDELIDCLRYVIYDNEDIFNFVQHDEAVNLSREEAFRKYIDKLADKQEEERMADNTRMEDWI